MERIKPVKRRAIYSDDAMVADIYARLDDLQHQLEQLVEVVSQHIESHTDGSDPDMLEVRVSAPERRALCSEEAGPEEVPAEE